MPQSELFTWIRNTLGADVWGKKDGIPQIPDQRTNDVILHYERELHRGRLTLVQAYERCTDDLQGRNHHESKPQKGKSYRAVTLNMRAQ